MGLLDWAAAFGARRAASPQARDGVNHVGRDSVDGGRADGPAGTSRAPIRETADRWSFRLAGQHEGRRSLRRARQHERRRSRRETATTL